MYTVEEIKTNRKVWTDALRSGRFKQGMMKLCMKGLDDEYHYCCLGVACEVAGEFGISLVKNEHNADYMSYNGALTTLPTHVRMSLGLSVSDLSELIRKNDLGASFAKIADYIDSLPITKDE